MIRSRTPKFKSSIIKRSVVIRGHKTSVSVEDPFWSALKEIAASRNLPIMTLIDLIDVARTSSNLSSSLRLYVLEHYRKAAQQTAPETTPVE